MLSYQNSLKSLEGSHPKKLQCCSAAHKAFFFFHVYFFCRFPFSEHPLKGIPPRRPRMLCFFLFYSFYSFPWFPKGFRSLSSVQILTAAPARAIASARLRCLVGSRTTRREEGLLVKPATYPFFPSDVNKMSQMFFFFSFVIVPRERGRPQHRWMENAKKFLTRSAAQKYICFKSVSNPDLFQIRHLFAHSRSANRCPSPMPRSFPSPDG